MNWWYKLRLSLETWGERVAAFFRAPFSLLGNCWYAVRLFFENLSQKAWGWLPSVFWARLKRFGRELFYICFLFFWDFRKRDEGRGARIVYTSIFVIVCGLSVGGWFLAKEGRHRLAVWRADQAGELLDSNQSTEAHLKALSAFLSYPEDLGFLRLAVKASREAKASDYRMLAEQMASHPDATVDDVMLLVDDFLEIGNIEQAERWLKVATEKGLEPKERAKRYLRMEMLAGKAGRLPALLRASAMVGEGMEDPEVAVAYASLCSLWKAPEQRSLAMKKLKAWTERDDRVGLFALQALTLFPELEEKESEFYRKRFEERMKPRSADEQFAARMRFLRKSREVEQGKENEWFDQLQTAPFSPTEKLALEGGVLWRVGQVDEGKRRFNQSLQTCSREELPLLEGEILSTGDLNLTILLLLRYRQNPWIRNNCDAVLIDLYRRANRMESAEQTAKNFFLASLRSKPNLLAATARAKILVSEDHLGEAGAELERLVAKYPLDLDFRELLGLIYHLRDKHRFALELVPEAPKEFPLQLRARIKGLRYACLQKLEKKSPPATEFPDKKEREALDPRERELLGIKL